MARARWFESTPLHYEETTGASEQKIWHGMKFGKLGEVSGSVQYQFGPLHLSLGERRGWFRLFGYGLMWKDTRKHDLRFSERNGYSGVQVFFYFFRLLT